SGFPSGVLHEGHKRPNAQGLDARVTLPACSMRAVSEPSERSGARRSGFPSGVFHEDRERADRSLGGSTPGNNNGLSVDLRKYLLQPGETSKPGANLRPYARKNGLQIP